MSEREENRFFKPYSTIRSQIWRDLSNMNNSTVESLLNDLGDAVNNGLFGVASMISDYLRSTAPNQLRECPLRQVKLELEFMKRLDYMGFEEPFVKALEIVLGLLDDYAEDIDPTQVGFTKFTALGHQAWRIEDTKQLKCCIVKCNDIIKSCSGGNNDKLLQMMQGFQSGMEGREFALDKKKDKSIAKFEEGLKILKDVPQSRQHLMVNFAEQLRSLGDWQHAIKITEDIFREALDSGLKGHLRLRAILLQLDAPQEYISDEERGLLKLRCWVLINAMGLSQMQTLYPRLEKAARLLDADQTMIFEFDTRATLRKWLKKLNWKEMEKVIEIYYRNQGYEVFEMPGGEPVFDLLAKRDIPIRHSIGIQVKHWETRITAGEIPEYNTVVNELTAITKRNQNLPTVFRWYTSEGITTGAEKKLRQVLEGASIATRSVVSELEVFTLDRLIGDLMPQSEWFLEIALSIESAR